MMTIHFTADLRPVVGDRVGMLHWNADPGCSGFIIAYDLSGNQVLISNFDAEAFPVASWTESIARDTVAAAIGRDDVPFEVLSFRPWVLSRKVAQQYHVGNVFLAGDAAHSFPPTGGLGLNSGLADVHNLAWKIAAVQQGWAGSDLLESYGEERRPIALVNSTQSIKNGKKIFSFLKTLGTAGIKNVREARENLHRTIRDPEKQQMIADEVEGQREHFDNVSCEYGMPLKKSWELMGLQLEIHIGYVYGGDPPTHASHFSPKFVAGARLPHAWIRLKTSAELPPVDVSYIKEFSKDDIQSRKYSTLDLCPFDSFTLLVGSRSQWAGGFAALESSVKSLRVKVCLRVAGEDFEFVDGKYEELFSLKANFNADGGLLVRPDQHLLRVLGPSDDGEAIITAVREHLGL